MAIVVPSSCKVPEILINLDTLKFAFQPIFDVHTGDIFGHEALMRPAEHSPAEIIEAYAKADSLSKIEEITFYYGTKAFKEANLEGYLFLNTFPGTCMSIDMALKTAELGGPEMANRFYIEILEYTKLDLFAWNMKRKAMSGTGATPKIAIDDYGTGENTDLVCLDMYKPDLVKIDRKYISQIDSNLEHQLVVANMIRTLKERGIKVLAEGVETEEEYNYLMHSDIDYMQGYYLGRPRIYQ